MRETECRRTWRQRLQDGGLAAMTIWVKAETKARYEALALQSHRSGSELAQLALDAYHPGPPSVSATSTETEPLRALIREELDQVMAILTATVTATVTETLTEALPALVQAAMPPGDAATRTARAPDPPPTPRGRRTVRGPARRRKAPTSRN
jgi:hypothetical protein